MKADFAGPCRGVSTLWGSHTSTTGVEAALLMVYSEAYGKEAGRVGVQVKIIYGPAGGLYLVMAVKLGGDLRI